MDYLIKLIAIWNAHINAWLICFHHPQYTINRAYDVRGLVRVEVTDRIGAEDISAFDTIVLWRDVNHRRLNFRGSISSYDTVDSYHFVDTTGTVSKKECTLPALISIENKS